LSIYLVYGIRTIATKSIVRNAAQAIGLVLCGGLGKLSKEIIRKPSSGILSLTKDIITGVLFLEDKNIGSFLDENFLKSSLFTFSICSPLQLERQSSPFQYEIFQSVIFSYLCNSLSKESVFLSNIS